MQAITQAIMADVLARVLPRFVKHTANNTQYGPSVIWPFGKDDKGRAVSAAVYGCILGHNALSNNGRFHGKPAEILKALEKSGAIVRVGLMRPKPGDEGTWGRLKGAPIFALSRDVRAGRVKDRAQTSRAVRAVADETMRAIRRAQRRAAAAVNTVPEADAAHEAEATEAAAA